MPNTTAGAMAVCWLEVWWLCVHVGEGSARTKLYILAKSGERNGTYTERLPWGMMMCISESRVAFVKGLAARQEGTKPTPTAVRAASPLLLYTLTLYKQTIPMAQGAVIE